MGEPYLVNLNILRYLQALKKSGARTSLMQRFKFQSKVCCLSFLSSPVRTISGQRSPQDSLQPTGAPSKNLSSEEEPPRPDCLLAILGASYFGFWSKLFSSPFSSSKYGLCMPVSLGSHLKSSMWGSQELNITAARLRPPDSW